MIAYRIQQANHPTEWLLDPERQFSTAWGVEDDVRVGISACESVEALAGYLAQVGIPFGLDSRIVEMECGWAEEDDVDAELGAILVIPTRIISETLVADHDEFDAALDAALA